MGRQSCHPFLLPRPCLARFGGRFFCAFHYIIFRFCPTSSQVPGRQRAKKGVCNSLGFIDFAIGPVNSALPFAEFKLQFRIVISIYQNFFWTSQSDF